MKTITVRHLATWAACGALAVLANCLPTTIELETGGAGVGGEDSTDATGGSDATPWLGLGGANGKAGAGGAPASSGAATAGPSENATGGGSAPDDPSSSSAGDGAGQPPLPPGPCQPRSLDVPWPVISGCLESPEPGSPFGPTAPRCPHPEQLNNPGYGPYVGCCPLWKPYSCPTGTPDSCYETEAEAEADCGDACVLCVDPVTGQPPSP